MKKTAEDILDLYIQEQNEYLDSDQKSVAVDAMKFYANQKLDEASEKANLIGDFWSKECDECSFFDTEHGIRMSVNKQSILNLKDEL